MSKANLSEGELLETTYRDYTCTYCRRQHGGHPSRLWEVRTVPEGVLRARVPECVLLLMMRKRRYTRKLTDPENAILAELRRMNVI
jgi:hypothetical protein